MLLARLMILLVALAGCTQMYSKDTIVVAGPELCGLRFHVLEILLRVREETPIANSEVKLDQVHLELTSSEDKKTTSILITWPEGFSCVIASGGYSIRENVRMAQ